MALATALMLTAAVAVVGTTWTAPSANAASAVTIWGATAPTSAHVDGDTAAVELGTRFTAVTNGRATGVRFYKTAANTGTHTGSMWTSSGALLGRVTFTGETASGWQTATFTTPITLTAGRSYVVSYHTNVGRYLATEKFQGTSTSPSYLKVGTSNVGVYSYGANSTFPKATWNSSLYWVDLTFSPAASPTVTPTTTPTPTASPTPTTSPTPTSTPTSTPSLCTTSAVWANLADCGWPGAANTGYPVGQVFSKTLTGGLTVSVDGTVIDGYKVSGGVTVNAKNVVIRNSWISNSAGGANGSGVVKILRGASATVDHSLLDGLNATHACIWHEGASMTATANECAGVNDGIFSWAVTVGADGTGDNFTIKDNWLHSFTTRAGNGHVDGYQTEGAKNGVIEHNTFDVAQGQTSAVAIWNGRKSASNIAVRNNLIQGGAFSIYAQDYSPSESSPSGGFSMTNITFTNNRFSNSRYACVGNYGVWYTRGAPSDGWRRSGNVLLETGQNLDTKNPVLNGWECR